MDANLHRSHPSSIFRWIVRRCRCVPVVTSCHSNNQTDSWTWSSQEGVARGLDVRTQQELANAFVAAAAYYVHNVTSRAEQANDAAHDAALSDSSSGAAKTEVPETAHEVLDTVTGVLDNATAVSDTATDVPSAVCDAGDE